MIGRVIIFLLLGSFLTVNSLKWIAPYYDISEMQELFAKFIVKYNKSYPNEEVKDEVFSIFRSNVLNLNKLNNQTETLYGINEFSDMPLDYFMFDVNGLMPVNNDSISLVCEEFNLDGLKDAPEEFDWRLRDAVTPVKHQGFCRAGWAFSAAANVESQHLMNFQVDLDLSEQQLLDCDTLSDGCEGGLSIYSFKHMMGQYNGIQNEMNYPYEATSQNGCRRNGGYRTSIKTCYNIFTADEELVKKLLYNYGPLSFGLDAYSLKDYERGVIVNFRSDRPNHGALLVGYGQETNKYKNTTTDFWLIKNSWGKNWGHEGYVKIQRGVNACNMTHHGFSVAVVY